MTDPDVAVVAWEALFRAQVAVMRRLNQDFPAGDLTLNEYDVLFNLSRQPERRIRMRDLNEHLLVTQPSVSRLVDRLAGRGLVDKIVDPSDARSVIVALTDAGFGQFRRVARDHMASIDRQVGGALSPAELVTLTELSRKLWLGQGGA